MKVKSNDGEGSFQKPPQGTHIARCFKIIDLGTQHNETYDNDARKMMICWELPTELIPDGELKGQPFAITGWYTRSLGEKSNLRRDLEAWRGKKFTEEELEGFDIDVVLGQACFINVVHSEDGKYANISSIMKLPKGTKCPDPVNPAVLFDLDSFDQVVFDGFSDKLKDMIKKSPEFQYALAGGDEPPPIANDEGSEPPPDLEDDDIPF